MALGDEPDVAAELEELEGLLRSYGTSGIQTEMFLRLLGLMHCRSTVAGGEMLRGLSGGARAARPPAPRPRRHASPTPPPCNPTQPAQAHTRRAPLRSLPRPILTHPLPAPAPAPAGERKRLSTAEMLVGPRRVLLMDEISTGLDSATLFSTIQALGMITHGLELTTLVSLLQPPPEVFELFDTLLLMSQDGRVLYHGPIAGAVAFFDGLGFRWGRLGRAGRSRLAGWLAGSLAAWLPGCLAGATPPGKHDAPHPARPAAAQPARTCPATCWR
jgi:hypothetical protein